MSNVYHVAKTGNNCNNGSESAPFLTINAAAAVARPGDTVIVHEGEYREWVNPVEGGRSPVRRITYQAAEGEKVSIKGSERIQNWENIGGSVWRAVVPNALFGDWNPYVERIVGDWVVWPTDRVVHLGDVYLNGKSFYEAASLEEVKNPRMQTEVIERWSLRTEKVRNPEDTKYLWFAEVDAENTTITANFRGADPNKEMVEINVRKCVFYPHKTGVDYITVRGFELCHAATPWAPPTGDQPGLIGPHWSKGWIIEHNIIHDAKASAVSLGKESRTGENFRTYRMDKPGYQYQLESVFAARKIGWSKETIGSHIVQHNEIYDCGQNGVVGHLGCVFSEISHNHIYNIAIKREFFGHEIGGIKLHAALDVQIHHNCFHDCTLGTWLDWQTQGTRISKNIYYRNSRDLFVEVSHGPYLVDNNIFAGPHAIDNMAQGGAYLHNLMAGVMFRHKALNRATPYHAPHSTDVTGYAMVYLGDDRLYQNIFVGTPGNAPVENSCTGWPDYVAGTGTAHYDGSPTSLEEYMKIAKTEGVGDLNLYEAVNQPVYINHNVYLQGSQAFDREENKLLDSTVDPAFSIEEQDGALYLNITLPNGFDNFVSGPHDTQSLGRARIVDADFENPDGSPLTIDSDLLGAAVGDASPAGPIAALKGGQNRIKIWG